MKHAYFLIFVVQLVSAFPNLLSEEGSTEIKYFSCNDIHDCIKIDENMHCFIDKVRILRILSYLISYFLAEILPIFSTNKIIQELVIARMVFLGTLTFVKKFLILNSETKPSQHSNKKPQEWPYMLSLSLVLLCLSSLPLFVWHCVVWVKINMLFIKVLKDDNNS